MQVGRAVPLQHGAEGSAVISWIRGAFAADLAKRQATSHWPLDRLQLCADCREVSLLSAACPGCGAREGLLTLSSVLDRGGEAGKQCAWCFPPNSLGHDPEASHGICRVHLAAMRVKHNLRAVK